MDSLDGVSNALANLAEEMRRIRDQNATLSRAIEDRDLRIIQLEEEKKALVLENTQLKSQVALEGLEHTPPTSPDDQLHAECEDVNGTSARRHKLLPAFEVPPASARMWKDLEKEPALNDGGAGLRRLAGTWPPSKMRVVNLSSRKWQLTAIDFSEMDQDDDRSDKQEGVSGDLELEESQLEQEQEVDSTNNGRQRIFPPKRMHDEVTLPNSPPLLEPAAKSLKRKASLPLNHPEREGFRRKAVCKPRAIGPLDVPDTC